MLSVEGRVLVKLMAGESQVNMTVPPLPQFVNLQFVTTIHSRVLFSSIALRPLARMGHLCIDTKHDVYVYPY